MAERFQEPLKWLNDEGEASIPKSKVKGTPLNFSEKFKTEDLYNLAEIAERGDTFNDMCKFMKALFESRDQSVKPSNPTEEKTKERERNLLSVAYKNKVGALRSAWRSVTQIEPESFQRMPEGSDMLHKQYQTVLEQEMTAICNEVLTLLKDYPIKTWNAYKASPDYDREQVSGSMWNEAVFFNKMCGDYYRYLAEVYQKRDDMPVNYGGHAKEFYQAAQKLANELPETHPTRLGLALNFSVCYYEILQERDEAKALAKQAFDCAIEKLDTLNDESYKDSTLIMQLLRDNLTLWTTEESPADEAEQTGDN